MPEIFVKSINVLIGIYISIYDLFKVELRVEQLIIQSLADLSKCSLVNMQSVILNKNIFFLT